MNFEEKARALLRRYGRAILILFVAVLFVHDIFGTHGFLAMQRTKREIEKVQAELKRLNTENQRLAEEVKELKSDPRKIESIARDELGLARKGEVIIKIPQGQQPGNEAAPQK
jgi:cell division protein FtsB